MTHLDLFSGIGGFALAARAAGFVTLAFCEYCGCGAGSSNPGGPFRMTATDSDAPCNTGSTKDGSVGRSNREFALARPRVGGLRRVAKKLREAQRRKHIAAQSGPKHHYWFYLGQEAALLELERSWRRKPREQARARSDKHQRAAKGDDHAS